MANNPPHTPPSRLIHIPTGFLVMRTKVREGGGIAEGSLKETLQAAVPPWAASVVGRQARQD